MNLSFRCNGLRDFVNYAEPQHEAGNLKGLLPKLISAVKSDIEDMPVTIKGCT